ncbi:hypothetical protein CEUSTIGMA_g10344.t1 [Chlamydomonas eustigma]|uniref:NOT2/NOT3/NOT5 C-terminal domain-containing protein n=1 Tax=Chlamydomonas eustigma TaxID=1157962 RepID=A0A250XIK9_9CHLO|nr:hypothetical protein CEUSTIGMA_g10344.t1 [Chlamydomonas eustigma]|eukprot:GAX82918.1 hypothetical protein CEUSTIGMA_g10344.t1 [Chlamydomonas eustigma]
MLNQPGLDPTSRAQQYGQQMNTGFNAPYTLGNISGALQANGIQTQLGVRGLAGLQLGTGLNAAVQQGRFPQTLQSNLQQLGQYQVRQGALGNAGLPSVSNGMSAAAAAVASRGGIGGINLGNPGLATTTMRPGAAPGLNLQAYGQSIAIGAQQQAAALNMNRLAGIANLQNNGRIGLGTINLLQQQQQQKQGGLAVQNPPHNLLSMLAARPKQQANNYESNAQLGNFGAIGLPEMFQRLNGQEHGGEGGPGPGPLDEANYPSLSGGGPPGWLGITSTAQGDTASYPAPTLMRKGVAGLVAGGLGSEFSMQNEDFPALGDGATRADESGVGTYPSMSGPTWRAAAASALNEGVGILGSQAQDTEQQLRQQQQGRTAAATAGAALRGGNATAAAAGALQDKVRAITSGVADRYGLLSLMPSLKMADPDFTLLTLGPDLTSLGLNLNATECLHRTFASPLSDNPIKAEPEFNLPSCYRHSPQRLHPGCLGKFKEETLFYVFYSMPSDDAQFIAADELYSRGWFWHRRFKLWMITAPGSTPTQKTARGERCGYLVFDPQVWEVVPREVDIMYEDLEQHPRLPRPKHMATTAAAATNNAGQVQAPAAGRMQ